MARKIIIELVVAEENDGDAETVVDALLENGILQDAINDHESPDEYGDLQVISATSRDAGEVPSEPCEVCGRHRLRANMVRSAGAWFGTCCWDARVAGDRA